MPLAALPQIQIPSVSAVANVGPAMAASDHELMVAVRAGDLARLGDLFERHHRPLYGFFVRLTNQPALAEDLVQVVFQRLLKYRHTYRGEGRFGAWIYHVARMVAADHFRRQARHATPTDPADLAAFPDPGAAPDASAATADDLALLRTALTHLDLADREILVLSRLQHLAHAEIARLCDCSVGAVKVRVHRALLELRATYFKLRREPAA